MSEKISLTLSELATHMGGRLIGDGDIRIERVANLDAAGAGEIAYVENEKFFEAGSSESSL